MAKQKKPSYEDVGKMLTNIYESGYIDRNQTYKMSFIKGIVSGVGGVIGATLVVALGLWVLSIFKEVPLLGPFTDRVRSTIERSDKTQ